MLTRHALGLVLRWTLGLGLALAVLGAVYAGYVLVRHDQPVALPSPTGAYPVGRSLFTWSDDSRTDSLSSTRPAAPRRLSVWVWFPAATRASAGPDAPYLPGAWDGLQLSAPVGWAETAFSKVDAHTQAHAQVAAGRFPVVVLLPGLGFAAPQYTSLAVDLASHGYLVAGVTPTHSANLTVLDGHTVHASSLGDPPGFSGDHTPASTRTALRLMRVWAGDARFAADQVRGAPGRSGPLAGHVDRAHVAYVGHSFGGTSSLEACRDDPHCVGAIDLDGAEFGPVVARGLPARLLVVGEQDACVTTLCTPANGSERADKAVALRLFSHERGRAWSVNIDGTKHFDFTDYAAYNLALPLRALLPLGSIDGDRALHITGDYMTRFLDGCFGRKSTHPLAARDRYAETNVRAW